MPDEAGLENTILAAYWTEPGGYARSAGTAGSARGSRPTRNARGGRLLVGSWWRPTTATRLSTSAPGYRIGLGRTPDSEIVPITTNGYFGAARDRVPLSAIDPLDAPGEGLMPPAAAPDSRGRHLLAMVPHNTTVLRSRRNPGEALGGEQLDDYLHALQPKLLRGSARLVAHRRSTGCLSLRIMTNLNEDGSPRAEASVYAAFLSIVQLETWAASHETHLDIYQHAIAMNRLHKEKREVVTWHELFVLQMGNLFEYVNCHPRTGLLPYARLLAAAGWARGAAPRKRKRRTRGTKKRGRKLRKVNPARPARSP